ncbi:FAD-dependent oxidoreductase [Jannaschia aquimarina]|uniref:MnmC_3 protein n=1 Tax=Jannaschia aquimarina TaxID=935700 RepID=A0A0D1D5I2_9RHOB|nr:FAD-dependent oxidoreductase [Jannaschia aquimarina]KIT15228.1 tRNA 5-methylaminomethyl-2-thiouridine biosynthesis bifunctional protein MnmC [Jannaschia aquimarina]SNT32616.1 Flavin containing amine oxidoreductase [Jannaschia aquimarina]
MIIEGEERYPDAASTRPHVIVVGAGVAGLTTAHRLLERGHDITLLEADSFLGGKLGAHQDWDERDHPSAGIDPLPPITDEAGPYGRRKCAVCTDPCCERKRATDWHEHCYHMYLNWYHNFWALMRDIGAMDRFVPITEIYHQPPDPDADILSVVNPGSPWTALHNAFAGVDPPADMFLQNQSMLDLLAKPDSERQRLDKMSVEAVLLEHGYTTKASRAASHRVLAKAFAAPTAMASARTFQSFNKYSARLPAPTMWLLDGVTAEAIFTPWLCKLAELSGSFRIDDDVLATRPVFRDAIEHFAALERDEEERRRMPSLTVMPLRALTGIEIDPDTGEFLLRVERQDHSRGTRNRFASNEIDPGGDVWRFDGQVVLTVPPRQLAGLVFTRAESGKADPDICLVGSDPALANVARLGSAPIFTLDIFLREPLERPLPRGIINLLGSKYEMTLYDNTEMWRTEDAPDPKPHMISVCASDVKTLMPFVDKPGGVQVVIDRMLAEMRRYVRFDPETDLLHCRTHLQTNAGEELFINAVDTWEYRPRTTTEIPNMTLAGDFVQTAIDVVTIEAAAMSGVMAAEAVRRKTGLGRPVPVVVPDTIPRAQMWAAAMASRPFAYLAKAASEADHGIRGSFVTEYPGG